MADRRHLYAVVEVPGKELLGTYPTIQQASSALEGVKREGATKSELFNVTHPKCPQWVRDLATEAHGRTSPEAEIHMYEGIVRISSRYVLSRKASNLMVEGFHWIPELDDFLEQSRVPGFVDVSVEVGDPDRVVITVDLEVKEGGDTKDPARRGAFQAVDRLLVDIARFKWHSSPEMKDDPFTTPVYTSTDFVIVWNEQSDEMNLSWSEGDDTYVVRVDDENVLFRLAKTAGAIARGDDMIENYAARLKEDFSAAPVPF